MGVSEMLSLLNDHSWDPVEHEDVEVEGGIEHAEEDDGGGGRPSLRSASPNTREERAAGEVEREAAATAGAGAALTSP